MSSQETNRNGEKSPGLSTDPLAEQQTVINEELRHICQRRQVAGLMTAGKSQSQSAADRNGLRDSPPNASDQQQKAVRESLVGVALSGGGVRSGAISLGFLMGLTRNRLLRMVDYLSTVSGGGYAGAMVTAEAERLNRARSDGTSIADADTLFREETSAGDHHESRPRHRLRHLIFNANYLIKNRGWASRALIGTLAMGTMLISALIFVCAALAWLCRLAYKPEHYDIISGLGFRGDIWVALLPSFVMFALWLFCWLLSYAVNRRRASGILARYVFAGWILSLVIGLTLIATTGDVEVEDLLSSVGISHQAWHDLGAVGSAIQSVIILGILTSLVPYFVPSALFRSGKERTVGPRKFVFRFARTGLLYGLPLLLFGYLARENISHWNQQRDARLTMADLMTPSAATAAQKEAVRNGATAGDRQYSFAEPLYRSPFLDRLLTAAAQPEAESDSAKPVDAAVTQQIARRLLNQGITTAEAAVSNALPYSTATQPASPTAEPRNPVMTNAILEALRQTHEIDLQLQTLNTDYRKAEPSIWATQTFGNEYTEKTVLERITQFVSQLSSGRDETDLLRTSRLKQQRRRLMRGIHYRLNRALLDYELFADLQVPANASPELQTAFNALRDLRTLIRSSDSAMKLQVHAKKLQKVAQTPLPDLVAPLSSSPPPPSPERDRVLAMLNTHESDVDLFANLSDPAQPNEAQPDNSDDNNKSNEEAAARAISQQQLARKILSVHRDLLRAAFPYTIHPAGPAAPVFNANVYYKDQDYRLKIMWISLACALVASLIIDLNATSWHGFYAQQLSDFWINSGRSKEKRISLQSANSTAAGYPYHLINAAVSFLGRPALGEDVIRDENPDDFLLSRLYCGSDHTDVGFVRTTKSAYGELTLGDAIALSGSAVSPWTTSNQLVRALFLVLNLRTGLWLPHPQSALHSYNLLDKIDTHLFPPLRWLSLRFMRIPWNRFKQRPPEKWSHLLVTDGGHYENLGIEPLLRRRCRVIVAVDSTEDEDYEFGCLANVINRVRSAEGIEFLQPDSDQPFQFPDAIVPDPETRFSAARICSVRIRYPATNDKPASSGVMILVKSTLLRDDPLELRSIGRKNSAFPNDPTSDQFFSPETFEAYHRLGSLAADQLADELRAALESTTTGQHSLLSTSPDIKACLQPLHWPWDDEEATYDTGTRDEQKPMFAHLKRNIDSLVMMLREVLRDQPVSRHCEELQQAIKWLRNKFKYLARAASVETNESLRDRDWDADLDLCELLAQVAVHSDLKKCRAAAIDLIELAIPHVPPRDPAEVRHHLVELLNTAKVRGRLREQIESLVARLSDESNTPSQRANRMHPTEQRTSEERVS